MKRVRLRVRRGRREVLPTRPPFSVACSGTSVRCVVRLAPRECCCGDSIQLVVDREAEVCLHRLIIPFAGFELPHPDSFESGVGQRRW